MNITPRVSICVPTFNGARYLAACLDSVFAQTYQDYEVLLLDDGSTDETIAVLEKFAIKDSRVRLVRNSSNLGLVGNWNRCVELARGEWIKFVFQDDLIAPTCVARMLAATSNRPLVFCNREFLFEDGTDDKTVRFYNKLPCISKVVAAGGDIEADQIRDAVLLEPFNFFGEPTAALIHCSLFERFGMFNADLAQLCDQEYWMRVSINTGISYIDESLATFRCHAASTSAINRDPLIEERVGVFDALIIGHEMAYNPHYSALRKHARCTLPKRKFQRELAKTAPWIHARARAMASSDSNPDASWINRWDELAIRYPGLSRSTLPYRAREIWMRHFGWRLAR